MKDQDPVRLTPSVPKPAPHSHSMLAQLLSYIWLVMLSALPVTRSSVSGITREARHAEVDVDALRADYTEATRSAEHLQAAFTAAEKKHEALRTRYNKLREEKARAEGALRDARARGERLGQDGHKARAEGAALRKALDEAQTEKQAASERAAEQLAKLEEAQRQVGSLTQKAKETSRELKRLQIEHEQLTELLNTRTTELQDAQVFLDTADTTSDAELMKIVVTLNELVYQLSASISSKIIFWRVPQDEVLVQPADRRLKVLLGQSPSVLLRSTAAEDTSFYAQLSLQAVLSCHASWIISAWNIAFDGEKNTLLQQIHSALFENEPQAVSARWRALTRQYATSLRPDVDRVSLAVRHALNDLRHVLILCGASEDFTKSDGLDAFMEKVRGVVEHAFALQKAIGEGVLSAEYQVICPPSRSPFTADSMTDMDDRSRGRRQAESSGKRVLYTTGIGLSKVQRGEDGRRAEASKRQAVLQIMVKADVTLFG
ncbi:hypothetical protein PHLGIDRAFT_121765 [Phlebiopsis gigantea 11061_1 CR5-6]|uniref:Uncharacterized protein n=1 Tax=Phlebiopsis gigantea (strain 11061_1 CR5-6) TaxID=745531 RepID=A0A0C3RSB8_PHLG1|nr:hypothetical protein PHLGIDRAFT_121765 [Phlebiopsis gigantea 11061_1 CR5-6]